MTTARELAFLVVRDTFGTPPRPAQAAFEYRLGRSDLDERDRSFAAELAYGTIKSRRLLNWWLEPYLETKFKALPNSIAEILRMGVYQLLCMNGVAPHAAVNETVGLAMRYGHRGTAGLVNAVLRRIEREQPPLPTLEQCSSLLEYFALRASLPTWIVERFAVRFGEDQLEKICAGLNARPQLALSIDAARISVDEMLRYCSNKGIQAHVSPFVADSIIFPESGAVFTAVQEGHGVVQSESAAMPIDILNIQPGETILELCAGRGNKTLQIAARLQGKGHLDAIELASHKAIQLEARLQVAGYTNVTVHCGDAMVAKGELVDAVVVDAPCSGLGILGRHPEARWRKTPEDAQRHALAQRELLRAGFARLRPGGRLIYSVCSPDMREGEAVIAEFVASERDLLRVALPQRYAPFQLATKESDMVVPPGIDGRDGFYVSLFGRR